MSEALASLAERVAAIARAAGREILDVYAQGATARVLKEDDSPLTAADLRSHRLIGSALAALTPDVPVLSEEAAQPPQAERARWVRHWLVDPLDGTREFLARNGEFTVNIALIERGRAVLGVVHVPAQGVTYAASGAGTATRRRGNGPAEPIAARAAPVRRPIVVHSRSHADEQRIAQYVAALPEAECRVAGSSVKFCLIAAGEADLYPRFGPTMEWDTGAAQAVLEAAGGSVTTLDGAPLRYGKPGFINPDFIARGR
jgi:3'(2'), 5'-bisphosphate nucleotidase